MTLKRPLITGALTAVLAASAVACGDDDNAATDTTEVVATTDPVATTDAPTTTTAAADPEPETTVPDMSGPASSEPPGSGPTECAEEPTVETAEALLVGRTEEEATAAAEECGWIVRVIRRDGEDLPATMDLRTNRVNVEVTGDEVTAVLSTG